MLATDLNTVPIPRGSDWEVFTQACWETLHKAASEHVPKVQPPTKAIAPMSDKQAAAFRDTFLPFGKYSGVPVGEVMQDDPAYLLWLADEPDKFKAELKAFLANKEIQRLTQPEDVT